MNRRFFLLAAPAIVAAPSLMKVSTLVMPDENRHKRHYVYEPIGTYARYTGYDTLTLAQWEWVAREISGIPDILRGAQIA